MSRLVRENWLWSLGAAAVMAMIWAGSPPPHKPYKAPSLFDAGAGGELCSISGIFGCIGGFGRRNLRSVQRGQLKDGSCAENSGKNHEPESESGDRITRGLLPKGFFAFTVILFCFVFCGILLLGFLTGRLP